MPTRQILTPSLLSLDLGQIKCEIEEKGYIVIENALTLDWLESIGLNFGQAIDFNSELLSPFYTKTQKNYLYALATSHSYFKYLTHPAILDIAEYVLGREFSLYNHRYYESYHGSQSPWHTDNKDNGHLSEIPGLVFLTYIVDTFDGQTELIAGSQRWSDRAVYTDETIVSEHQDEIVALKYPAGTLLIYDTRMIHRASRVNGAESVRKTVFFRIDAGLGRGEANIVNCTFLKDLDDRCCNLLNFGCEPTQIHNPISSRNLSLELNRAYARRLMGHRRELVKDKWRSTLVYRALSKLIAH